MASNSATASNLPHNKFSYDFFHSWPNNNINSITELVPNIKPPTKRNNRPTKRTTFTSEQVTLLELEFAKNEYICKDRRGELAQVIDLTECQVKTWFQNRRTKKRRCNSPLRKSQIIKSEDRSPSPLQYIAPTQPVPNLQSFFQGWPTRFPYPLSTDSHYNNNNHDNNNKSA
ncbi:Protein CBG14259 [Caenorhabditis briggsae]|uniref:Homeobox domain-containing protein n=2 Tax=Caenorhabditis briggsae TaxID=6238 RepID=A0AAE8ZWV7_CAEBR|nr:Protein CBG14259 [Caenorhabditis briggsae]ULT81866.1 hypothetical protein L3Y34_011671 [Caenorhabditis briggsae]UMM41174.1 hypothetical protein L5515_017549 [Caenorhabditis briggsae]CAP32849.2 Protein CBG14259 [Caenorhabditis briggsae]